MAKQQHTPEYYLINKERLAQEKLEKDREYRDKTFKRRKSTKLNNKYGISIEEYDDLFEKQKGLCAICGKPESAVDPRTGRYMSLAVDHDHITGKIRGLLCAAHNRGVGFFQDSPESLRKAADYLENNSKDKV